MPTFLAGFCAPGGPLTKTVSDFSLKNSPLPGDQQSPWEFQRVTSLKIFRLADAQHFWRVFALLVVLWQKP